MDRRRWLLPAALVVLVVLICFVFGFSAYVGGLDPLLFIQPLSMLAVLVNVLALNVVRARPVERVWIVVAAAVSGVAVVSLCVEATRRHGIGNRLMLLVLAGTLLAETCWLFHQDRRRRRQRALQQPSHPTD